MSESDYCDDLEVRSHRIDQARQHMVTDHVAGELAETYKALADPTRVRLISLLAEMELCVGELAATLEMTVSAVSHQLRLLRRLRLVKARREGRHVYYTLDDEHIDMMYHCGLDHIAHT